MNTNTSTIINGYNVNLTPAGYEVLDDDFNPLLIFSNYEDAERFCNHC